MTSKHDPPSTDELRRHGDGEYEPHRPPKYVEGVYKPHFADSDSEFVLMRASMLPQDHSGGLYWATADSDGDASGVVRRLSGKPITEGADHVVGFVRDGEVEYREGNYVDWAERIDDDNVPEMPDDD